MGEQGHMPAESGSLSELLSSSPDVRAHTSVAAELALLLGLAGLLLAPFSVMFAISLALAVLALLLGIVGVAMTSKRDVTGSALAPLGMLLALITLTLLGLRYLGVDTAFGDRLMPDLVAALDFLNSLVPGP